MEQYVVRKSSRLPGYDYSKTGAYFVTFCTEGKRRLLGTIVGGGVLDAPLVELSKYGRIVKTRIEEINLVYDNIQIDKYVIMPNHVHIIVFISAEPENAKTARPSNSVIPQLISTIKRLTNRQIGRNIWQRSYYDHIIRNEQDYLVKWKYIDDNPAKWAEDDYYCL